MALVAATALSVLSTQTHAAPGPLSQVPLFLAQGVQPNIFFLLDDSGSMDWEVLKSAGAIDAHGPWSNSGDLDFDPGTDATNIREHCWGYNVMAYNPNLTYTPWSGVDTEGNVFTDQSVSSAMVNPYTGGDSADACDNDGVVNNGNGRTCDLLNDFNDWQVTDKKGAFYVPWEDDGDGVYQNGECSTNPDKREYVQDMSTEDRTNYANWFSYYRKREYVMKRAVSQIIAESRDRLGLGVINNSWSNHHITNKGFTNNHFVGTPIKDMDDLTLPVNSQAVIDKAKLIDNLLGVNSSGGTPLRQNLESVGDYFRNSLAENELFAYGIANDNDSAAGYSPILKKDLGGTCQQNFVVLLSDGFWNGGDPNVGNADSDVTTTDATTGDTTNASIFDGQSYADAASNTLADVAMSLYKGDLLTALDNEVPAVSIPQGSDADIACYDGDGNKTQECFDLNEAQHLVTFTVSFGVTGTIPATDAAGNECVPGNRTDSVVDQGWPSSCDASLADGWPTPSGDDETTADDMKHAAWNGRGLYLPAKDPDELINRLQQAIGNISSRKPVSASAVAVDTFNVVNGGVIFQGRFDAGTWSGEIYAREYVDGAIGANLWEGHVNLNSMDINSRILVTYNGVQGVPFAFPTDYATLSDSTLSSTQVNDLLHDAPYAIGTTDAAEKTANQDFGASLVDYLRGDVSNEGASSTNFRKRYGNRLGDIIHSSPVYVGNPDPTTYPDTIADESYQTWANNAPTDTTNGPGANGRREMLYVGANDGALHAFDADTGDEVFAYYPHGVFSTEDRLGLHWLADVNYEHRYYVDVQPAVGEVYTNTGDGDGETWRTLLVGGLRGGGRTIYALDVSDPSEFTDAAGVAGNILWEFTHDDLGYTYSMPTIAKLNDGRWAAIFGNGYNQTGANATGQAALFIKYLDNATPSSRVFYTGVGSISNSDCADAGSDCNGLSTPAVVDLGADRVADRVYAGDLKGNLWVFDISSSTTSSWGTAYGTAAAPEPLFQANYIDADTSTVQPQPITAQPIVTLHPTERHDATQPNTMVFFGTGQYMAENDPITEGTNSFYGIWDSGSTIDFDRNASTMALVEQTVSNPADGNPDIRLLSNNPVNYDDYKGWFIDLPDDGERVIVNPIVFADLVIYTTMVPYSNLCSDSAGYSWLMVHNLADGSEPDFVALDISGDGAFDGDDQVDGSNVAGVKSGSLYWQPTLVKSGVGPVGTLFIPTDTDEGIIQKLVQGALNQGSRSSWGIYRFED
ncbi:MAG: PilC/PilY family type IV pilus protein [Candidatus Thiodiazotropha sp.]